MRTSLLVLFAAAVLSMVALTGCNSRDAVASGGTGKSDASVPADGVKRISLAEGRAAFDGGKAVMIDVRGDAAYKAGHITGSTVIALNDLQTRAGELPKDKTIILYCSCPAEQSAILAAQKLQSSGVNNTVALVGGYPGWKAAGYPVEEPH
jgi:rhodanese-related sulfurtransferase